MNVDLMRKVDYWIGIPFCFILSVIYKVKGFFFKGKVPKETERVLFLQISEMGSTVLAYSAIKRVQEKHPDAEIYYLIFREMAESIRMLDIIPEKNIITIRSKSMFGLIKDTLSAVRKLRKLQIDAVIDLELFSRFSNVLSYLSGGKYRVGFYSYHQEGLYRGSFQTHKVWYNPHHHISLNFLSLVYAIEQPAGQIPMVKLPVSEYALQRCIIKSTEKEKDKILKKLQNINPKISFNKKIIVFNPNASLLMPLRRWPLKNYIELAKKLLEDRDVYIVIIGVKSEKPDARAICGAVNDRCIDFTGMTSLRELIDLFNISKAIVSNDSGSAHFASLTPIRIFVFFGPETPALYGPPSPNRTVFYSYYACSPCVSAYNHRKSPCKNNKCLQAISVDDVYDEVKKFV